MCLSFLSDIATLITGFATIALALLTQSMVKEIKKQRESSYFPDLFIDTFSFRAYGNFNPSDVGLPKFKELDLLGEKEINDNPPNKYIFINILNVGLGAAKDIKYSWNFDFNAALVEIKKSPKYDVGFSNFIIEKPDINELPLAIISPSSERSITMPYVIWSHYLYYLSIIQSNGIVHFDNLPKPILKIKYADMQNMKFNKSFIFSFVALYGDDKSSFTVHAKEIEK